MALLQETLPTGGPQLSVCLRSQPQRPLQMHTRAAPGRDPQQLVPGSECGVSVPPNLLLVPTAQSWLTASRPHGDGQGATASVVRCLFTSKNPPLGPAGANTAPANSTRRISPKYRKGHFATIHEHQEASICSPRADHPPCLLQAHHLKTQLPRLYLLSTQAQPAT